MRQRRLPGQRLRGSRSRGRRAEDQGSAAFDAINITPFTDVLLVLLIIFMIAGSAMAPSGLSMSDIGTTGPAQQTRENAEPVVLEIDAVGEVRLRWEARPLSWEQLEQLPKTTPLLLSPEPASTAELMVETYDRLLRLGFSDIVWGAPREPSSSDQI